ncbi:MAG TPA: response regulator [Burkholderiaceae bacterium]
MTEQTPEFRPIDRSQHELLVVDDNPASRYATVRQLRAAGFRTREAATGAEGLALADDGISAIVLDIHLPDIDGLELCARLRSRPSNSRMPVLHLTAAYVTDDDKVRGLDNGADAYLTRPVEPAVLVATVQALVRTRVAEEAMRRSEQKFRAIYAQSLSGIALLDDAGVLIDANPAMESLLGRPHADLVSHALVEFAPEAWVQATAEFVAHQGAPVTGRELPMRRPDGSLAYLEWTLSPHIEPGVTMATATDVEDRVRLAHQRQQLLDRERIARGEAEQVNRMKDDFIAVLSHELRTPLNAIMGWTHVLQQRGGTPEALKGLAAIERNGRVQARIISDLLDMSRLNLGKLPLNFATLDPAEELQAAVAALRPATDSSGVSIDLDLQPSYRPIRADSQRLQQVVWNLLSNAVKFSPQGGRVAVAMSQEHAGLRIRVSDSGQGIAPEFLPFVFDRFAQSDAASNRQRGGLGLGLSIVKQLVEAHGGTVSASSAGVGRGATFEVFLPAAQEPRDEPEWAETGRGGLDPLHKEALLDGVRLLVVDDDAEAGAMLQLILGDHGAQVRVARDVETALRMADMEAPDLVVSDIGMPGRDGYDLVRELRRREALVPGRTARLPAIALTSFTRDQDRQQALAAGFDLHSPKPVRPLALVQQIRQLLDRRR